MTCHVSRPAGKRMGTRTLRGVVKAARRAVGAVRSLSAQVSYVSTCAQLLCAVTSYAVLLVSFVSASARRRCTLCFAVLCSLCP